MGEGRKRLLIGELVGCLWDAFAAGVVVVAGFVRGEEYVLRAGVGNVSGGGAEAWVWVLFLVVLGIRLRFVAVGFVAEFWFDFELGFDSNSDLEKASSHPFVAEI